MTVSVVSETFEWADAVPNSATIPAAPVRQPVLGLVASGSQGARVEWVKITHVNAYGESAPSPEAVITVPANYVITVRASYIDFAPYQNVPLGWNVYVATSGSGNETKQNSATLPALITNYGGYPESEMYYWTEPAAGLISGASLPTTVAALPAFQSGLSGLINTPPVPYSDIHIDNTVTNTGRTAMATQTFLAKFSGIS